MFWKSKLQFIYKLYSSESSPSEKQWRSKVFEVFNKSFVMFLCAYKFIYQEIRNSNGRFQSKNVSANRIVDMIEKCLEFKELACFLVSNKV